MKLLEASIFINQIILLFLNFRGGLGTTEPNPQDVETSKEGLKDKEDPVENEKNNSEPAIGSENEQNNDNPGIGSEIPKENSKPEENKKVDSENLESPNGGSSKFPTKIKVIIFILLVVGLLMLLLSFIL